MQDHHAGRLDDCCCSGFMRPWVGLSYESLEGGSLLAVIDFILITDGWIVSEISYATGNKMGHELAFSESF